MKTPAILITLLLVTAVCGTTVKLSPTAVYEATNSWTELEVNNYNGTGVISSVLLSAELPVAAAANYTGWSTDVLSNSVHWLGGTIETNVRSAAFGFKLTLPKVNANTNTTLNLTLGTDTATLELTILDDKTGPLINNVSPNGYLAANQSNVTVSAIITDSETGVESATFTWNDCSGPSTTKTLTRSGDLFSGTASFTGTSEGSTVCYVITATNNGGASSTKNGTLTFDGTAPTVVLNSPLAFANELTNFSFTATDNIASSLDCELKLGGASIENLTVVNGTQATTEQDLSGFSDGMTTWSVRCKDGVGLEGTSSAAISLDSQPPTILVNVSTTLTRAQAEDFTAIVTDQSGVASVSASFAGDSVSLTQQGEIYQGTISSDTAGVFNLTVTAKDNAGHERVQTVAINVVLNHQLGLALTPSTAKIGQTITAWGSVVPDGSLVNTTVTLKLPDGDVNLTLANDSYSTTFAAPDEGTYSIVVDYSENGVVYRTETTLTVVPATATVQEPVYRGSGPGFDSWRYSGGVAARDGVSADESSASEASSSEQVTSEPAPASKEYAPLEPDVPRQALTPKATGVFTLGNIINWIAVLFALVLITILGVYAYRKRKPDSWERYFNGR